MIIKYKHIIRFSQWNHICRVTHICVSKQTSIGSDNGLSPGRRQAIIWTNAGILLIGPLGTSFSKISIEIHILSFKKMHLKISSRKWRPFCLGLNVLNISVIQWWLKGCASTVIYPFHHILRHHLLEISKNYWFLQMSPLTDKYCLIMVGP